MTRAREARWRSRTGDAGAASDRRRRQASRAPAPEHRRPQPCARGGAGATGLTAHLCRAALGVFLALGAACDHGAADLGPTRDLRGAPAPALAAPELQAWPLRTHADFDRVEDAFEARASLPDLAGLLLQLSSKRPDDHLLLARTALLWLDGRAGERSLQTVFDLAEKLRTAAPDAADTRYLLLAIKRVVVWDPESRSVTVVKGQEDVARRYAEDVRALVAAAPDYVGPHGVTAATLKHEAEAVELSLVAASLPESDVAILPDGAPLEGSAASLWSAWARFVEGLEKGGAKEACQWAERVLEASPPAELAAAVNATCGQP